MKLARRLVVGVFALSSVMLLAGCNPQNPYELAMQQWEKEKHGLQADNDQLRRDLAKAMAERDDAIRRYNEQAAKGPQIVERQVLPPGWQEAGPFRWATVSTDLLFDSGKASLKPAGRARLQEIVNEIRANYPPDQWDVLVLGHTDRQPIKASKWADNLELSVNRGATVFREIQRLGIEPIRMLAAGQGEYNPVVNSANANAPQNRRVEIIMLPHRPTVGSREVDGEPTEPATPTRSTRGPARPPAESTRSPAEE
jgi:flagellar motor protein MotB